MVVARSEVQGGGAGCLGLACALALLFSAAAANARDGGDWTMQFNPYLWGSGLSGSMVPADIGKVAFTIGGD